MSVPIHNLYDFLHAITKKRYHLIYFYPFGSRALDNVILYNRDNTWLNGPNGIAYQDRIVIDGLPPELHDVTWVNQSQPVLCCHDQEPLNFDLYLDSQDSTQSFIKKFQQQLGFTFSPYVKDLNLRWTNPTSLQKTWILLHSELNSSELVKYENTGQYKGAYWWSHAVIARDWYRYAEHDLSLKHSEQHRKLFLVYCRDVTGSRQYRQTFLNQLSDLSLLSDCQTQSFNNQSVDSSASAVYNVEDINNTAISVVLETVFDSRIHLTEKILRPIACGHPFILAAGPHSLAVLKKYGFKTFMPWINEEYDTVSDNNTRIDFICQEMKRLQQLPNSELKKIISECQHIARENQKHFFSKDFTDLVTKELVDNVQAAADTITDQWNFDIWWQERKWRKKTKSPICVSNNDAVARHLVPVYRKIRQSRSRNNSRPISARVL